MLRAVPKKWIALIAPYVYIAGLGILLSILLYAVTGRIEEKSVTPLRNSLDYWTTLVGWNWLLPVSFLSMLA
jgi:hypothetical protein